MEETRKGEWSDGEVPPVPLVTRLLHLDERDQPPYDDGELARLRRSRMAYAVQFYLGDQHPGLADRLRKSTRAAGLPIVSLEDLVRADDPAEELGLEPADLVELLDRIKANAKLHYSGPLRAALPPELAKLIYYTCIALALVHAGDRISSLNDRQLREGFDWARSLPWGDDRLRELFGQATSCLPPGTMHRPPW